jgi:hypothetical protein
MVVGTTGVVPRGGGETPVLAYEGPPFLVRGVELGVPGGGIGGQQFPV